MPYRLEDAEYAIVGSGCMIETAEAAVDYMRDHLGIKVGSAAPYLLPPLPLRRDRARSAARQGHLGD